MRYLVILLCLFLVGCKDPVHECKIKSVHLLYPLPCEYDTIKKLFPLLDILDEQIDWTSGVRFYKVRLKETKEEFEVYWWLGCWNIRKEVDGRKWFKEGDRWWRWNYPNRPKEKIYLD